MRLGEWSLGAAPRRWAGRVRARRREVGGVIALASLVLVAAEWSLRDPWPAIEIVDPGPDRRLREERNDGPGFLAGSWDRGDFWELPRSIPPQPPERQPGRPDRLISADGRTSVEARGPEVVRVDAATGAVLGRVSMAPLEIASLDFGPGERSVRVVVHDGQWVGRVVTWDLDSGKATTEPIRAAREFRPIGRSLDERIGAYEGPLGSVHVWDLPKNRGLAGPLRASSVEPIGWGGAVFAPDGRTMAVARGLGKVEVWDLPGGRLRRVLRDHPSGLATARLAIGPDGRTLARSAIGPAPATHFGIVWDALARWFPRWKWFQNRAVTLRSVALYDLASGRFLGQATPADYPRFSPDGRFLATWRAETGDFAIRPVPPPSQAR